MIPITFALTPACGSGDDDAKSGTAPLKEASGSGTGGSHPIAAGGSGGSETPALGGTGASGGTGGDTVPRGGSAGKGGSAGSPTGKGGSGSTPAGAGGTGGSNTATAGQGTTSGPPGPQADGSSPYDRECHGDTVECVDVNALRCLGIRDGDTVFGYGCSNTCEDDGDCSTAPSSGDAKAACVDFVTQKHCLLVCSEAGKTLSCPSGMGCYVYPGATIGYCLWQ